MCKGVVLAIMSLVILLGCTKMAGAADCNDTEIKQKVLEKVGVTAVAIPAFLGTKQKDPNITVDEFLKNTIKTTYSNNRVSVTIMGPKGSIKNFAFTMKDIRATNFNKDIGKYECACNITREMDGVKAAQPMSVNYTSELTDGNKHYVSVTVLNPFNPSDKTTAPDMELKDLLETLKAQGTK
jgi:hypothetical protein